MKGRSVLLGIGSGIAAGYALIRTVEALIEWRKPSPPLAKDAMAYARIRRSLEVADTARATFGFLAFAYGPLSQALDSATRATPVWLRPGLFFAPLSLVGALADLPASFVQGYTLERRFGLSNQSRRAWLEEYAKSALLGAGLTAFLGILLGVAVRHAPRRWPWIAGAGTLPLFVAANVIVPLYVLPLFNKFEPVVGSLEARLRALAARFGVGDAAILRMDMSRQTRKANAFVTGIGRTHRIVVGDTLIASFPENETEFVVAHELGHYVNKDTWRMIALGEVLAVTLFLIANRAASREERAALRKQPLMLVRIYAVMLVATQVLRPLLFAFSRSREWAADRFAIAATNDALAGASAFRRLRDQNLADEDPPYWYELFFSSHPSLRARIAALERSP
ncbi:MAG: M48 family metallopeptidase [Candidatus Eremiobacteraeota bacterium]|nr:M48 family metallopeptidase [Candidatus Eremiobacteraeota bacterium]